MLCLSSISEDTGTDVTSSRELCDGQTTKQSVLLSVDQVVGGHRNRKRDGRCGEQRKVQNPDRMREND